ARRSPCARSVCRSQAPLHAGERPVRSTAARRKRAPPAARAGGAGRSKLRRIDLGVDLAHDRGFELLRVAPDLLRQRPPALIRLDVRVVDRARIGDAELLALLDDVLALRADVVVRELLEARVALDHLDALV